MAPPLSRASVIRSAVGRGRSTSREVVDLGRCRAHSRSPRAQAVGENGTAAEKPAEPHVHRAVGQTLVPVLSRHRGRRGERRANQVVEDASTTHQQRQSRVLILAQPANSVGLQISGELAGVVLGQLVRVAALCRALRGLGQLCCFVPEQTRCRRRAECASQSLASLRLSRGYRLKWERGTGKIPDAPLRAVPRSVRRCAGRARRCSSPWR